MDENNPVEAAAVDSSAPSPAWRKARIRFLRLEILERQNEIAALGESEDALPRDVSRMPLDAMTEDQHRQCGCGACVRWLENFGGGDAKLSSSAGGSADNGPNPPPPAEEGGR